MTKPLLRDESQLECVVNEPQLIHEVLIGDGIFPNSPLPLLLYRMNYGKPEERPTADKKIAHVPLPRMDPVYGTRGPLVEKWSAAWHA